jgi:hypothetical protein
MGVGEPPTPPTWDDLTAEEQEVWKHFSVRVGNGSDQLRIYQTVGRLTCTDPKISHRDAFARAIREWQARQHDGTGFPPGEAS